MRPPTVSIATIPVIILERLDHKCDLMVTLTATTAFIAIHGGEAVGYRCVGHIRAVPIAKTKNDAMRASRLSISTGNYVTPIVIAVIFILHAVIVVPSGGLIER
jgi:hypothetical protein